MDVMIDGVRYVPAQQDEIALSVLVPSISRRRNTFAPKIADALFGQHERLSPADQRRVEILMLTDCKGMLVGDKRNAMVRMARGQYVVFVDDDDRVSDDYLSTLLLHTAEGNDCITFDAMVSLNGGTPKVCNYSLNYTKDNNSANRYERLPNHITAVRRVLALATPFPSRQCGEDADYAARLRPTLRNESHIGRVLYYYDYSDTTTETQGRARAVVVPALPSPALVDVVIMSKASTLELQEMCQRAVTTCIQGAAPYKINVLVIEQAAGKYVGAETINDYRTFNYNRFANCGAARGQAPWIMIANSDLVFEQGWLHAMICSSENRECLSPVDPSSRTQKSVRQDTAGWQNGHHFSGWCFMVTRKLWERVNGFDECVSYWCSDDVVIEQCRAVNVMPLLVSASRVRHLGSQTGNKMPEDDLSWAQVRIFNEKYPARKKFTTDGRYIAYCKKNGLTL